MSKASTKCKIYHSTRVRLKTYRSERLCVTVKNLLLVVPVGACAIASTTRAGSTCGAGGSLVIRPVVAGAMSGRLRGLRTKEGAASSSSSSSSVILTRRRRFGVWLLSAGSVSVGEGSATSGLFPATLSSVVGRDGPAPPRRWCIEDTEQCRPLAGLRLRDSPC